MKKIFGTICCISAIVALAACSKEKVFNNQEQTPEVELVPVTITGQLPTTKTFLGDDKKTVKWTVGDAISVFGGQSHTKFEASEVTEDGRTALFDGMAEAAESYSVVYPYNENNAVSGNEYTVNIPAVQTATAASFDPLAAVSVGASEDLTVEFKNVGALISLTVGNENIKAVVFSTESEELAGEAVVTYAYGDEVPVLSSKNGSKSVALTGDFVQGTQYYFMVYPGQYEGFTISFINAEGKAAQLKKTSTLTVNRNANLYFGTVSFADEQFQGVTSSTKLFIEGPGAENLQMSYHAAGHYDTAHDFADKFAAAMGEAADNYFEVFTQLEQDKDYYFRAENGLPVNANNATYAASVETVAKAKADQTSVYCVRLYPGNGHVKTVRVINLRWRNGWDKVEVTLPYVGGGVWEYKNFNRNKIKCNADDRYRFVMSIWKDGKAEDQAWGPNSGSIANRPGKDNLAAMYVRPTYAPDWDPLFKFPDWLYDNATAKWYSDLRFVLNASRDRYFHECINEWQAGAGPMPLKIGGEGAEAGQQFNYLKNDDWYNVGDNFNDFLGRIDGFYYEIFTHLDANKPYYFYSEKDGMKYFSAADFSEAASAEAASTTVSESGEYRIRINIANNAIQILPITNVCVRGAGNKMTRENASLSYIGGGVWKGQSIVVRHHTWDNGTRADGRYKFNMSFNTAEGERTQGLNYIQGGSNGRVQWGGSGEWDERMFTWPGSVIDPDKTDWERYTVDITLNMNTANQQYNHALSNVKDTHSSFEVGDPLFLGCENAEGGRQFFYLKNSDYYSGGVNDVTGAPAGNYYEMFLHLDADKPYYFYYNNGVEKYLNAANFAAVETKEAASVNVAESGEYRIRVDAATLAVTTLRITEMFVYGADNSMKANMSYIGDGVWKVEQATVTHKTWDNATRQDNRYMYRMVIDGKTQAVGRSTGDFAKWVDNDSWASPGFRFNELSVNVIDPEKTDWSRYKADFTLVFNNANGKYHQIVDNVTDTHAN